MNTFRDALFKAFKKIGGIKHLSDWAEDNPTEFYRLFGRVLAQEKPPEPPQEAIKGKFVVATQLSIFDSEQNDESAAS